MALLCLLQSLRGIRAPTAPPVPPTNDAVSLYNDTIFSSIVFRSSFRFLRFFKISTHVRQMYLLNGSNTTISRLSSSDFGLKAPDPSTRFLSYSRTEIQGGPGGPWPPQNISAVVTVKSLFFIILVFQNIR